MSIVQDTKNNKLYGVLVSDEKNDLLNGSNIAYGALTTPSGFPSSVKGYQGPGGWVDKFQNEQFIYARDTGRLWQIQLDDQITPAQALILIAQGSAQPSGGGSSGPDIVLVVADKAGKYAGFSMSSAVYSALPAAVAAVPVGGADIIMLNDTYTLNARLAIPTGTRLVALSKGDVSITSADVTGTLESQGDLGLVKVSVSNTGGAAGVVATTGGTHTYDGAVVDQLDALTTPVSVNLNLINDGQLSSFVGSVAAASSATVRSSRLDAISLPGVGSNVSGFGGIFDTIEAAGAVELQQGEITSDVGTVTVPTSLTADGTVLRGASYTAGAIDLTDCKGTNAANYTSTVGTIETNNCRINPSSSFIPNTDTIIRNSSAGAVSAANGSLTSRNSDLSGAVTASTVLGTASRFASTVNADSGLDIQQSDVVGVITTGPGSNAFIRGGSRCTGVITLGNGGSLDVEQSQVLVANAGAGNGAIINDGGVVTLKDSYVRANDTGFSVSGTGSVATHGYIGGGCRFNTAGGLTVAATTSDVRGHAIFAANPINANTDLDTLAGVTEVYDMFTFSGIVASGFVVRLYQARNFPIGFEMVLKNVDILNGVDIAAALSETIDGSSSPITLAPNDFRRLRKIGITSWTTC